MKHGSVQLIVRKNVARDEEGGGRLSGEWSKKRKQAIHRGSPTVDVCQWKLPLVGPRIQNPGFGCLPWVPGIGKP